MFTWVTAHVCALGHLLGIPRTRPVATRALDARRTSLHDDEFGGWFVIDRARAWHHELGASNTPSHDVWPGKPDLYHAFQATVLPVLPLAPGLAVASRDEL